MTTPKKLFPQRRGRAPRINAVTLKTLACRVRPAVYFAIRKAGWQLCTAASAEGTPERTGYIQAWMEQAIEEKFERDHIELTPDMYVQPPMSNAGRKSNEWHDEQNRNAEERSRLTSMVEMRTAQAGGRAPDPSKCSAEEWNAYYRSQLEKEGVKETVETPYAQLLGERAPIADDAEIDPDFDTPDKLMDGDII